MLYGSIPVSYTHLTLPTKTVHARPNYHSLKVRLQGLNPNLDYRLEGEMENECVYGGDLLMNAGMLVPSEQGDYRSYLYHFVAD